MKQKDKQNEKETIDFYKNRSNRLSHALALEKKRSREASEQLTSIVVATLESVAISNGEKVFDDIEPDKLIGYRLKIAKPDMKSKNTVKVEQKADGYIIGVILYDN